MQVSIYSRKAVQALIDGNFPPNTAVISFHSPLHMKQDDYAPVDYAGKPARLMYVCAPDLDIDALPRFGMSYETFMPQAEALAAILEHYERRGIDVFADYRYYPNQVVFNRVREALRSGK